MVVGAASSPVPQKLSAGLLPFRVKDGVLEVFLVHPGGPFWARKDEGAWSIAKGEYEAPEDPRTVACRELEEETGFASGPKLLERASLDSRAAGGSEPRPSRHRQDDSAEGLSACTDCTT